jgi:SAM-dependent methyltransferase
VRVGVDSAVEWWLGVHTRGVVQLDQAGAAAANRVWYAPSEWVPIWRSLTRLRVGSDDVCLDYGSGLGRVLVVARRLPFRRVIGVEVSPQLAVEARANLRRQRRRVRCRNAEVVEADAARWSLPDDVTIVYLYCPFTGPVFARAIDRVLESYDRRPRRMRVVYNNPYEHNYLLQTGRFRPMDAIGGRWLGRGEEADVAIVTYELLPVRVEGVTGDPAKAGGWAGYRDSLPALPGEFESAFRPASSSSATSSA